MSQSGGRSTPGKDEGIKGVPQPSSPPLGQYGGWNDDPYNDCAYEFDVECTNCGTVYGNLHDGPCPSCGSSSQTFSSLDARDWTEHLRRTGR